MRIISVTENLPASGVRKIYPKKDDSDESFLEKLAAIRARIEEEEAEERKRILADNPTRRYWDNIICDFREKE